ncbi:MAG TPA: glycosyltransferase [Acidobacteriaceae bacterium]|nr:glycosyltransferase [Acidobacteriaceae bacterium]
MSCTDALEQRGEGRLAAGRRQRRVIIVTSHFPPSNLASVHRSRLFAQHLPEFGWNPVIVTVHHRYYEEALDWDLDRLVPTDLRVERVGALGTKPVRIVGDVGVRGFLPMLRRILGLIDSEETDFVLITVPSFFAAPLGRLVHALRGIPYGIDYQDPWVHVWPGSERPLTKAWMSKKLGEVLEPFSVRSASLITGVSHGSFEGVLERNPYLKDRARTAAMPCGGERDDHVKSREGSVRPYLFGDEKVFRMLYAGSMWDGAREPLDRVFRAIAANRRLFAGVRFHFVGTGLSPTNPAPQIKPIAERYGIWGDLVLEHPKRIPYTHVLAHLEAASGLFMFGSVMPHYTPSKLYQGVLAGKPIMAVLHEESTACAILRETGAGRVLAFAGTAGLKTIEDTFANEFTAYRSGVSSFSPDSVRLDRFEQYSARGVSGLLAQALDDAVGNHRRSPAGREPLQASVSEHG